MIADAGKRNELKRRNGLEFMVLHASQGSDLQTAPDSQTRRGKSSGAFIEDPDTRRHRSSEDRAEAGPAKESSMKESARRSRSR